LVAAGGEYLSTYNPALPFWIQFDWSAAGHLPGHVAVDHGRADLRGDALIAVVGLAAGW
jgi:hypothetical protein